LSFDQWCAVDVEDREPVGPILQVCCYERADDDEDANEAAGADEELGPPAPSVRVDCTEYGACKGNYVLESVEHEACVVVGESDSLQHGWVVVGNRAVA
jgi:hypothetical protein